MHCRTHTDVELSNQAKFKTEATPTFVENNPGNFHVSYAFDNVKKSQVLNKATIKFPKRIIKHASCIKHIEVNGEPDNSIGGSETFGRSMTFAQRIRWESFGGNNPGGSFFRNPGGSFYNPGNNPGGSSYNPGNNPGGSSYNPGNNPGGSSYNPGNNPGGSSYNPGYNPGGSSYNPGSNPGGSSYNPGRNPGGSSYNPGNNPGGSSYNPGSDISDWSQRPAWNDPSNRPNHVLPDNWGQYLNPNCPPGGSSMSNDRNYNPNCYWNRHDYDHNHVFGEGHHSSSTARPPYNSNPFERRNKRGVTSRPPIK